MALRFASRLRMRLLTLSLIGLLPALLVIVYSQTVQRRQVRERALDDNLRFLRLAARQPASILEGAQHLLQTLAQFPELSGDPATCRGILTNVVRDHPGYTNLFVIGPSGAVTCASGLEHAAISVSDRPWFERAMRTRAVVVGGYQIGRTTGSPDIVVAVPVLGPDGAVERVIGAGLTIDLLGAVVASAALPPGATLTLMDRDRTILARRPDGARWIGRAAPVPNEDETNSDAFVDVRGIDGVRRLYVTVRVQPGIGGELYLGMGIDEGEAFAAIDRLLQRQVLLLGLVALAAMAAGLLGGEAFVLRPIRTLSSVAERLAAGDLGARAQLAGALPGLSELGDAVNTMAVAHEARERERDAAEARLRAAEQQLRQAQKMEAVGQLAGGIAHDFNNLLTVVTGYSEMALAEVGSTHEAADAIREIAKAGARAATLTAQLLAFGRKQVLAPEIVDPHALIAHLQPLLRRVIGADVELVIDSPPGLGAVMADPNQIDQVLINLAVNARDSMPGGGVLTIATRAVESGEAQAGGPARPGRYIVIAVSDSGTGMDAETQARIFEPFFTTKGPAEGSGLGLAMVHGIVQQSGGEIVVASTVGAGSTFSIYLPWVPDAPACDVEPPSLPAIGGDETILVAEDEPAVRRLTATALRRGGYTVLEAGSGREALVVHAAAAGRVAMLVTDVVMPKMSGLVLAAQLSIRQPDLKVLCVSGYSATAAAAGATMAWPFLAKPFVLASLLAKVREVLDAR